MQQHGEEHQRGDETAHQSQNRQRAEPCVGRHLGEREDAEAERDGRRVDRHRRSGAGHGFGQGGVRRQPSFARHTEPFEDMNGEIDADAERHGGEHRRGDAANRASRPHLYTIE